MLLLLLFPGILFCANLGAAVAYAIRRDFCRALYFIASAICVLAVALKR